jgi:hypothetical protein
MTVVLLFYSDPAISPGWRPPSTFNGQRDITLEDEYEYFLAVRRDLIVKKINELAPPPSAAGTEASIS